MAMTSDTCGASSKAATRGIRSLPKVVDGPSTWEKGALISAICGASVAASGWALASLATSSTRATPAICAASAGTGDPGVANTATTTSDAPSAAAAFTHFAVAGFNL